MDVIHSGSKNGYPANILPGFEHKTYNPLINWSTLIPVTSKTISYPDADVKPANNITPDFERKTRITHDLSYPVSIRNPKLPTFFTRFLIRNPYRYPKYVTHFYSSWTIIILCDKYKSLRANSLPGVSRSWITLKFNVSNPKMCECRVAIKCIIIN